MLTQSLILALATQLATIEGQVRDARTHAAIPFARIELWRGQIPVDQRYTDADGKFRFAQLASSRYTIAVDYVGYESSSIELDLTSFRRWWDLCARRPREPISGRSYRCANTWFPKSAQKEFDRARKAARQQDCPKAVGHFENGLRIYEQDASAHNDLGNCYRKLGQLDRAEDSFQRARALGDSVYVSLNLAEVYSVQGRFEEARTVLLEAIRKQPSAGDAYYALALVYFQEGRLMEAESAAVQAHARPHQIADVHLILAEIYRTQQQAVAAAEELQIYLKEAPSGPNSERVRAVLKSLPK